MNGLNMKKQILEEKVYYYEDCINRFEELMKIIDELDEMEKSDGISSWLDWTASNDKNFIYGLTKTYDLNTINNMQEPYKSKMLFVYNTIFDSFYNVCKDYAASVGDTDEPNLFPVFNIKKYNVGVGMGSHFDQNDGDVTLRYSFNIYLNDDFKGGEVSFTLSEYKEANMHPSPDLDYEIAVKEKSIDFGVKPKAGSIIIFPSAAPYYHTAHLVKSNFKYMIPGHWIHNNMEMKKR
jgi:hypothetical protein